MKRQLPIKIKRIVIKVGSSVLTSSSGGLDKSRLKNLVEQISKIIDKGFEVVLVSSGAIASGMSMLRMQCRPGKLSCLQATAAIGQAVLMQAYNEQFKKHRKVCAQILLTWDDFADRKRYVNAKNTLLELLAYKSIPIVNENDTVSIEEIKFGDNDRLSALVANLVEAQILILLSDVNGFYKGTSSQRHVLPIIDEIDSEIKNFAGDTEKKHISIGGMASKLDAAKIATESGIPCLIANGKTANIILKILEGEQVGTLFLPKSDKLEAKKRWIAHSTKPRGKIMVDNGAKDALVKNNKSLLCPGIIDIHGDFVVGDIVSIVDKDNKEFAKGLTNVAAEKLRGLKGCKLDKEVIHRNSLVIIEV